MYKLLPPLKIRKKDYTFDEVGAVEDLTGRSVMRDRDDIVFPNVDSMKVAQTTGDGNCLCHALGLAVKGKHDYGHFFRFDILYFVAENMESLRLQREHIIGEPLLIFIP